MPGWRRRHSWSLLFSPRFSCRHCWRESSRCAVRGVTLLSACPRSPIWLIFRLVVLACHRIRGSVSACSPSCRCPSPLTTPIRLRQGAAHRGSRSGHLTVRGRHTGYRSVAAGKHCARDSADTRSGHPVHRVGSPRPDLPGLTRPGLSRRHDLDQGHANHCRCGRSCRYWCSCRRRSSTARSTRSCLWNLRLHRSHSSPSASVTCSAAQQVDDWLT